MLLSLAFLIPVVEAESAPWRTVKSWTGSGTKETESFDTSSSEWRINWITSSEAAKSDFAIFQIYVYDANGKQISVAANAQRPGSDTSYVHTKGRFYLKINSANCNWKIVVEDQTR